MLDNCRRLASDDSQRIIVTIVKDTPGKEEPQQDPAYLTRGGRP